MYMPSTLFKGITGIFFLERGKAIIMFVMDDGQFYSAPILFCSAPAGMYIGSYRMLSDVGRYNIAFHH